MSQEIHSFRKFSYAMVVVAVLVIGGISAFAILERNVPPANASASVVPETITLKLGQDHYFGMGSWDDQRVAYSGELPYGVVTVSIYYSRGWYTVNLWSNNTFNIPYEGYWKMVSHSPAEITIERVG